MTNEEKAKEISHIYFLEYEDEVMGEETSEAECYNSALKMAEWKDEQFKTILDKMDASVIGCYDPEFAHGVRFVISDLRKQLNL